MRVLMLAWEFAPNIVGGLGRHVTGLVESIGRMTESDADLDLHLLTPRATVASQYEVHGRRFHVHRVDLDLPPAGDFYDHTVQCNAAMVKAARRLAATEPFELLHVHDWLPAAAGLELMEEWKIPLLATMHATESGRHQGHLVSDLSRKIHALEHELCHRAWRVIVCSYFMRNSLMAQFGKPMEHFHVIPNGIDTEPFRRYPPDQLAKLRAQYKPHDEPLLLFVGRLTHEKGLHVLLDAMPQILAQYGNARLLVMGRNSEHLHDDMHRRGLGHAVCLLGYVEDGIRNCLLKLADAAVFPSLYEPFGIVALEAMAAECPVIVSDVGGLPEVVRHNMTGLTVYPNDPGSIFWAVDQVLSHPLPTRRRAKRAVQLARDQFNWARIARRTLYVYDELIDYRTRVEW